MAPSQSNVQQPPDLGRRLFHSRSPDLVTFSVLSVVTIGFLVVVARELLATQGALLMLPLILFPVLALGWVAPNRLEVFEAGVRVRTITGTRQLRFSDMLAFELRSIQLVRFPTRLRIGGVRRAFVFRPFSGRGASLRITCTGGEGDEQFQAAREAIENHRTHWKRG